MPISTLPYVNIYFNDTNIYVTADVNCSDRRNGPRMPVHLLQYPPDAEDIGRVLFILLQDEVPVVSPEEFDAECAKVFQELGVRNFDELESHFWFIPVCLDLNGVVNFQPMQKCKVGGYISMVKGKTIPFSDISGIGELARECILNQDRTLFVEDESHT